MVFVKIVYLMFSIISIITNSIITIVAIDMVVVMDTFFMNMSNMHITIR